MRFLGLALCLTLLAFGVSVLAGSFLSIPFLRSALRTTDPAQRARRLLVLRLAPAALAFVVAAGVVLPAFVYHEPRGTEERVGPGLLLAAVGAGALLVAGTVRYAAGVLATRRVVRRWRRTADAIRLDGVTLPTFAIDEHFPIVAVAGAARPNLFVSRRVLERCSSEELAAIVAHEAAHLRRRDPLSRTLLRACPDPLACTPYGHALERAWEDAAEEAADDDAAAGGAARSLDLASALLAVARLAGESALARFPPLALYRGGGVAGRVTRLLEAREIGSARHGQGSRGVVVMALGAIVTLLAVTAGPEALQGVHAWLEAVVLLFHR